LLLLFSCKITWISILTNNRFRLSAIARTDQSCWEISYCEKWSRLIIAGNTCDAWKTRGCFENRQWGSEADRRKMDASCMIYRLYTSSSLLRDRPLPPPCLLSPRNQPLPSRSHFSAAASFITFITHFRSHLATFWTFCHLLSHRRIDVGRASFFPAREERGEKVARGIWKFECVPLHLRQRLRESAKYSRRMKRMTNAGERPRKVPR
jgi:hypothetical protein